MKIENLPLSKGLKKHKYTINIEDFYRIVFYYFPNVYKINLMFKMKIDGIPWELAYFRNKIYKASKKKVREGRE